VILVSLEFDAVHDQIAELCRRYGIAELSGFGSVARGEDRPDSDVDLLYVSASDSKSSLWDSGIYAMNWHSYSGARSTWYQRTACTG
jgi:UTP:GlnB (protein PII) uridylyltransferase